ncbi:paraslipin [Romeria aff. gracilis LEGE 07310]|uniref:Paraslipin n=1 Tax=Vasconcelosia minhoensis LEGE 07310 TaxID=915328 RepID=A0A8J7A6M4_9CYAN|nr:stomatin-like protein [Romeria gracilis]MBE9077717.1 paraslipin [Romeria aff. gracilis LEGE 07310]
MGSSILAILSLIIIGYTVGSVRIVKQGNEALVERLGRFKTTLRPGLNLIVPFLDTVVLEDTLREQTLDIKPQTAITRDNVSLSVDAIIYWRILDLEKTFYAVEDVEFAMQELVVTSLRSEIGKMDLQSTFSSRESINKALLDVLDEATEPWGVKVNRVELQEIKPPPEVIESMQQEQAAAIKKKAAILEAEGTVQSMRLLAQALDKSEGRREILNFLLAQRYVEANQKIGESDNSKVLFMDPRALTEGLVDLMNEGDN